MSTSASAATSSPTSADSIAPPKDRRILPVVIVLGLFGAFIIAGIIWYTIRLKRRESRRMSGGPFQGTSILDRNHPATRITPFGAPSNAPSFHHKPGEDMRIAYRRPDGAWLFADSRTPFTPVGVSDLEVSPVSAASSHQFFQFSPQTPMSRKEKEAQEYSISSHGKDGYLDYEALTPPPPAYKRHEREDPFL